MNPPKVSIVLPSFNHARFIGDALESVIQQDYKDVELLILDDASSDGSAEVIREYINQHPGMPIRFSRHDANQGGVLTLNHLIGMGSGVYVALINSDDVWLPGKLGKQVDYLDQHAEVGAVFTQAIIVDENQQPLSKESFSINDVFIQSNRPRGAWLRHFFFEQNCLCHPSVLIRRKMYDQVGLYDPRFRQVPDLQMWVRLLKRAEIHILEEPLVHLRWHASNTNEVKTSNNFRGINELFYLYRDFFDGIPDEIFRDGFGDLLTYPEAGGEVELECEKAFLYFTPQNHIKSLYYNIGLERLYRLLGSPEPAALLTEKYHFGYEDFFRLGGDRFFDHDFFYSLGIQPVESAHPAALAGDGGAAELSAAGSRISRLMLKFPAAHRWLRGVYHALHGKPG